MTARAVLIVGSLVAGALWLWHADSRPLLESGNAPGADDTAGNGGEATEAGPVDALVARLADPDAGVRMAALEELARLGPRAHRAMPAIARAAQDPAAAQRLEALRTLVVLDRQSEQTREVLRQSLSDEDPRIRHEAATWLLPIHRRPRDAVSPDTASARRVLLELWESGEGVERRRVLDDLIRSSSHDGEEARIMVDALDDPDPAVRSTARRAVSLGVVPLTTPGLRRAHLDAWTDPDPHVRAWAVEGLSRLSPDAPDETASSVAVEALSDPHLDVRQAALRALSRTPGEAATRALIGFLESDAPMRSTVPGILASDRTPSKLARAAIEAARADPDPMVRRAAEAALETLVRKLPALERLTSDDPEQRAGAAAELGWSRAPSPGEVQALVAGLFDAAPEVRQASLAAITRLGPAARAAGPALRQLFVRAGPDDEPALERALVTTGTALVRLQRTACADDCPVYRVMLLDDGTVYYVGQRSVATIGRRRRTLERQQVEELRSAFEALAFHRLAERYWSNDVDRPVIVLAYRDRVVRYQQAPPESANRALTEALEALAARVDEITDSAVWVGFREREDAAGQRPTTAGDDGRAAAAPVASS